ncbi:hypothetical protein ACFVYR_08860 [Streptomyces sp. NPDC058284]|uniref:hypothetical protein n=1 Tax=unclassified Streptomyces TaxID=2593676 RepID=UPI00364835C9
MTTARSDLQEFQGALQRLWEAAGKPPYSALLRLDDREFGVQTVSSQSLSDWFTGKSAPSEQRTKYAHALIRHLAARAPRWGPEGRQQLGIRQMESLLARAQAERRRNRGGRPRTAARPEGRAPTRAPMRAPVRTENDPAPAGPDGAGRQDVSRERLAVAGRGVGHAGEPGDYFVGRTTALTSLVSWLNQEHDRKARVVTGSPGMGKSALLGRLLALTDPATAVPDTTTADTADERAPDVTDDTADPDADPTAVLRPRPVTVVLDAHHTTLDALTGDLAEAVSGRRETSPDALLRHLRTRTEPVTILVDALDEAGPAGGGQEAVRIAHELLRPLSAMRGVRLVVGTRRPLVDALGPAVTVLDLDEERWADPRDIADYAARLLLDRADPDSRSPYRDRPGLARTVADGIAARAGRCFLVARMTARYLVDGQLAIDTERPGWRDELPSDVGQAFAAYLRRFGPDEQRVRRLLTALAHAQGAGLPESLWAPVAEELSGRPCAHEDIDWARREHASAYVYVTATASGPVFRLFHEALAEYLRGSRGDRAAHVRITGALRRLVPAPAQGAARDWPGADPYILRHLAAHAVAAGQLDDLLGDAEYLVHADPRGLTPHLHRADTASGRLVAAVYRTSVHLHADASPGPRRQILALDAARAGATSLQRQLNERIPAGNWVPRWATGADISPTLRHTFTEHTDMADAVACTVLDGRPVAVTGGRDGTVLVWDLASANLVHPPLTGHTDRVQAVACTDLDGRPVAVSAGRDLTLRVWDLASGGLLGAPMTGNRDWVQAMACVDWDGSPLAVTGGYDGTVLVWDLATGALIDPPLTGHTGPVNAVACTTLDGTPVAVTAGTDMTVRTWNLATGTPLGPPLQGKPESVDAVACTFLDARPVAVACAGGTLQVWDLATHAPLGDPMTVHKYRADAVACSTLDGMPVAVVASAYDGRAQIWDLTTRSLLGRPVTGHTRQVHAVACAVLDGRPVGVTGGDDRTVRVWDLAVAPPAGRLAGGDSGTVKAVACTVLNDRHVAVSGDDHGVVRVRDVATGAPVGPPVTDGMTDVQSVACMDLDGRPVVVTGGTERRGFAEEGHVRVRDLASGAPLGPPVPVRGFTVDAVTCTRLDGVPVAVTCVGWGRISMFGLVSGRQVGPAADRIGASRIPYEFMQRMDCTDIDGRPVIVTGGDGETVRVRDLASSALVGRTRGGPEGSVSKYSITALVCMTRAGRPVAVTGSSGGTVRLWYLTGRVLPGRTLGADIGRVQAMACADVEGTPVVAAVGGHETVHVWDLARCELMGRIGAKGVRCVTVTTDGHIVLGMGRDVAVFTWRPRPAH